MFRFRNYSFIILKSNKNIFKPNNIFKSFGTINSAKELHKPQEHLSNHNNHDNHGKHNNHNDHHDDHGDHGHGHHEITGEVDLNYVYVPQSKNVYNYYII
jgi:hypothetical protein